MSDPQASSQWVVYAGVGLALAVALPAAFHQVGLGPPFLPMHLPVLIVGALSGPRAGLLTGALAPGVSHLATGMPPVVPPIAPLMTVELAVYGLVAGLARRRVVRSPRAGLLKLVPAREYAWLIAALLAGRVALGLAAVVLGPVLGLGVPGLAYLKGAVVTGLPGLAVQLAVVPTLVARLQHLQQPAQRRVVER